MAKQHCLCYNIMGVIANNHSNVYLQRRSIDFSVRPDPHAAHSADIDCSCTPGYQVNDRVILLMPLSSTLDLVLIHIFTIPPSPLIRPCSRNSPLPLALVYRHRLHPPLFPPPLHPSSVSSGSSRLISAKTPDCLGQAGSVYRGQAR